MSNDAYVLLPHSTLCTTTMRFNCRKIYYRDIDCTVGLWGPHTYLPNYWPIPSSREILRTSIEAKMLFNVLDKFELDLLRKKHLIEGYEVEARSYFNNALSFISTLRPSNIIVNLTNDHSIYFRFYNVPLIETHLEVFYTKDSEDDFVEAVLTTYHNDEVVLKQFGETKNVFALLKQKIMELTMQSSTRTNSIDKKTKELEYNALSI
ncbi:hypothetical protein [Chitinophaga filiformis]|uniref:Uncharacterized protein n=1 Tax=Chitinophaga filiformis TaxID=104663 RepID=A0ABY4HXN2_CHIFI|nr:hypothetical protein [Chitinophaga filiformis]UPK68307.1 hypothetical protein MYF79_25450 [Chitinophaga filiformis]